MSDESGPVVETAPLAPDTKRTASTPARALPHLSTRPDSSTAATGGISIGAAIVQAKLTVGPAGDRFEREADDVADRVVRSIRAGSPIADTTGDGPTDIARVQRSAMSVVARETLAVHNDSPRVIRRKSAPTPKCTQTDLDDVKAALGHIRDGKFDPAMNALPGLKYKPGDKPGLMKRSKKAHKDDGVDALEKLKKDAKTLAPKDTMVHATNALQAITAAMGAAFIDDVVRIGCKIAHNLMAATLRNLIEAEKKGKLDDHLHHGTSSAILNTFTGELLSARELDERGITRRTGEGNSLSGVADLKNEVFVGMGAGGGGTSAGYATASGKLAEYNLDLLSDAQLAQEIKLLKDALAAKDLADGDVMQKLQDAADAHHLPMDVLTGKLGGGGFNDAVLSSELAKYEKEKSERKLLPADHPRRSGNDAGTGSYPILFEFEHRPGDGVVAGGSQLAEGIGKGSVDMRGALVRAFAPFARLVEFDQAIAPVFPLDDYVVVPLEAYEHLPKADGNGKAMWDTVASIQRSQTAMHALRDAKIAGGKK